MDTKLTKPKYNNFIKFSAIILAAVFAYMGAVNTISFCLKGYGYSDIDGKFNTTYMFMREQQNIIDMLCSAGEYCSGNKTDDEYENFLDTECAENIKLKYEEKEKEAIKLYKDIQILKAKMPTTIYGYNGTVIATVTKDGTFINAHTNEEIGKYSDFLRWYRGDSADEYDDYGDYGYIDNLSSNVFTDWGSDDEEYYGEVTINESVTEVTEAFEETGKNSDTNKNNPTAVSEKSKYSSFTDWASDYKDLRIKIFSIVNDARSEDTIKNELSQKLDTELDDAYVEGYRNSIYKFSDKIINTQYLLINNKTKRYITNVDKSQLQDFIKNIDKDNQFYLAFDGKKLSSPSYEYVDTTVNPFEQKAVTQTLPNSSYKDIDSYMQQLFEGYSVYLKVNETLEQGDMLYRSSQLHSELSNSCKDYLIASVVFILLTLAVTVFLCIMSGKRKDGSIKLIFFDKIPFIINLALAGFLVIGSMGIAYMFIDEFTCVLTPTYNVVYYYNGTIQPYFFYKLSAVFTALSVLVLIAFILYIVRNVKAKTLKDRFILPKLAKFLSAKIKQLNEASNVLKHKSKYIVFLIFLCALFLMLTTFLCMVYDGAVLILIVNIIATILITLYALMYASNVITLSEATKKLKNGDLDISINPKKFVPQLRQFAFDLIESKNAIEKAVEDAVKGERLKTELITNVSHDLKTPLTSIINYVSLLKMCEIENEDAKGYIDILDEKSNKLKRLIEDLVEASKATSGNIKMTFSTVKLNEMALQMVGENSDVLESAGLESILTQKDEDIFVKADSQHTYRIFENLFSNVKKYSQSGTRVYIDIYKENGYGVFSVKNVSRERLNISPDELTERFVRGDNSRTTSGSGLGLSIAKDFTELQNGIFEIVIDGDMFKVNVKLPLAK